MQLKGKTINFLGDSITEGVGASEDKYRYVDQIAAMTGAVCRNYGVSGTRISQQPDPSPSECLDWDYDFLSRAKTMLDADVVVVFGGTNDFGHGYAPIGKMEDRSQKTFYGALHCLFTYLMERFPKAQLVVMTPLHRDNENNPMGDGGNRKTVATGVLRDYVVAEREVAEYYSIPVLDLYAVSGIQPAVKINRELYLPDGLHPSDLGHRLIAEKFVNFMKLL
ncbi:MAG: SGNH-hydro domain-containing protein [Lachnoclostridium sp.]|jgi:lysophospholipase L1-like esterase